MSAAASRCGASSTRRTSSSTSSYGRRIPRARRLSAGSRSRSSRVADFKGMKCRQTGLNAEIYAKLGQAVVNMPGGEIVPAAQRGVIDCAEWVGGDRGPAPRPAGRVQVPLHPGHAREQLDRRVRPAPRRLEGAQPAAAGGGATPAINDAFISWNTRWQRQNADAIEEMIKKHGVQVLPHPARHPDRLAQGLGRGRGGAFGEEPDLQEGVRVAARVRRRRWCRPSATCTRRIPSPPTTTGRRKALRPAPRAARRATARRASKPLE